MQREAWVRQYRQGLMALYSAGKVRVKRQEDGTLLVLPPAGNRGVTFDPASGRWASSVAGVEASGVGFISLARHLGLDFTDALAPYLSQDVG